MSTPADAPYRRRQAHARLRSARVRPVYPLSQQPAVRRRVVVNGRVVKDKSEYVPMPSDMKAWRRERADLER